MPTKIGMVSLGCPKNQVDAEMMMHKLREAGYALSQDPALAEVVIINTCGFIESAKQEAIEETMEYITLKKEGRIKKLLLTGCLAERYREEIREEMPEVDAVVGHVDEGDVPAVGLKALADDVEGGFQKRAVNGHGDPFDRRAFQETSYPMGEKR